MEDNLTWKVGYKRFSNQQKSAFNQHDLIWFPFLGLKSCVRQGYSYIEGVEELLSTLKDNGYEMHAFTNYPIWYDWTARFVTYLFVKWINPYLFLHIKKDNLLNDPKFHNDSDILCFNIGEKLKHG